VIDLPACACRLLRAMLGAQPAMTAGALVVTAALASKDFAAPGISRFVVAGAEVPLNDPAPPFLLAAIFTPSLRRVRYSCFEMSLYPYLVEAPAVVVTFQALKQR